MSQLATSQRFETSANLPVYMKDVVLFSVLEKSDEVALGFRIKKGHYFDDENKDCFNEDAQAAISMLVCANLRYVVREANKFVGQGVSIDDLINEGNEGLLKAARKYDPSKNQKFITFAHFYLQKAFNLANGTYGKIVRIPQNQEYDIYKRRMAGEEINTHTVQLDRPIGENGDNTLGDIILRTEISNDFDKEHDLLHINVLMSKLDKISQIIITKKFGLDGEDELTDSKIAAELNINVQDVKKKYKNALIIMQP